MLSTSLSDLKTRCTIPPECWRHAMDRRLQYLGIGLASWMTIAAASQVRSPLSQSELADILSVSGASMVHMIDRLVKAGLVIREPSISDRRVKSYRNHRRRPSPLYGIKERGRSRSPTIGSEHRIGKTRASDGTTRATPMRISVIATHRTGARPVRPHPAIKVNCVPIV